MDKIFHERSLDAPFGEFEQDRREFDFMFHPDEKTLQLFVMGQLNESQEDALEEHLDQCGKCRQRLDVFERKNMELDPFLCEVKAAGNIEVFSEILSGSCIQNQFRLEKKLGSGGMGVVWKAFDKIPIGMLF